MKKNYSYLKNVFTKILLCYFFMHGYNTTAQNLNFTIDTAISTGTTITETLTNGADTYVLTVDHSLDSETLDDLGGGDLIFYHGGGFTTEPFVLSITKNGNPTNFNLIGIDYDTLEAGAISVTNQDGNEISAPTNYSLGAGAITITNPANALSITQINIIPGDNDDLNDFGFHNIVVDVLDTLSFEEFTKNQKTSIYPNPVNDILTIKSQNEITTIRIFDTLGKLILNQSPNKLEEKISVSNLKSGTYFLGITSQNGLETIRFVKK